MTKILVTGSQGMFGQDLCPMLREEGFEVFETDVGNMDITDITEVERIINTQNPDYIVHAAAYTDVDGAETCREKAMLINETGSKNIAEIAKKGKKGEIPVIYISTDYVFDGTNKTPYKPDSETNPVNFYGKSKLAGENIIKSNISKHYTLRTSWLYGHKGKNFVETMINLALKNTELRVVNDQTGCPTWTIELAKVVLNIIKNDFPYGTYHVCGAGSVTWYGFARKIMEYMNINTKITPVTTGDFPRPAKRPAYSVMDNGDLCPDWQDSLLEYLKLREHNFQLTYTDFNK